jgi:hypothetical protein
MSLSGWSKRMFAKKDPVDDLSLQLGRARARRDAIAADVTTLAAEIAELEARLVVETDRRERARVAAEIAEITHRLDDAARTFAPAMVRLRDATAAAGTVIPHAGDLSGFIDMLIAEVSREIDSLMSELDRRAESARTGETAMHLSPPRSESLPAADCDDRMPLLLPALLRRKQAADTEAADDQPGFNRVKAES